MDVVLNTSAPAARAHQQSGNAHPTGSTRLPPDREEREVIPVSAEAVKAARQTEETRSTRSEVPSPATATAGRRLNVVA
ncbi:MAG: hypothetical protein H7831_15910 [Magnetococcus sp. WYHC-3]